MPVCRAFAILLLTLAPAPLAQAQVQLDERTREGRAALRSFDAYFTDRQAPVLACSVSRYRPMLDFSLRLWTGYNLRVPVRQFELTGKEVLTVLFRVRPQAHPEAVRYFWSGAALPRLPTSQASSKKVDFTLGGGVSVGPGRYDVDWMAIDESGRRCRESWTLDAGASGASLASAPDTVEPAWSGGWSGPPACAEAGRHLSIFVSAAPVRPRREVARLSAWDRHVLTSTVNSLLRNTPFCSASLVLFDLERRQVLWHESNLSRESLRKAAEELSRVDLATISMDVLRQGPAPQAFLETMLRKELAVDGRQRTVVFVGSTWRSGPRVKAVAADVREALGRPYLVVHTYPGAIIDGALAGLVRSARGRVLAVMQPKDLASAEKIIAAGQ